jgi:L-fucose mutarotase
MKKNGCIHPELMAALSKCGHGDKILIADGNYPLASKTGEADKVYLGLSAGIPKVTDVLKALLEEVNFEKAEVMMPEGDEPEIFGEFRSMLPDLTLDTFGRYEFYDECCKPTLRLAISTGEKRVFANILLTVGCA